MLNTTWKEEIHYKINETMDFDFAVVFTSDQ